MVRLAPWPPWPKTRFFVSNLEVVFITNSDEAILLETFFPPKKWIEKGLKKVGRTLVAEEVREKASFQGSSSNMTLLVERPARHCNPLGSML
jgi:hypothetical protein